MIDTELAARRRWIAPLITVVAALIALVGTVVVVTSGRSADPSSTSADIAAPSVPPTLTAPFPAAPLPLAPFTATPVPTASPVAPVLAPALVPTSGPATAPARPTPASEGSRPRSTAGPRTAPVPVAAAPRATGGGSGNVPVGYGPTHTGTGTFYGATGAGSCLFDASSDLMVTAMNQQDYDNAQACGSWLAVTGPNGKTITVRVVDRCPECPVGALDLSQQAFAMLAPASAGKITVSWRLLSPALRGPVTYVYKTGSSQYWCGIQVRNHRNPVRSLAVQVGGTWKALPRKEYNYFESSTGAGCGSAIQITDIYGHQLTDTGIAVRPNVEQAGRAQFGPPA